MKSTTVEVSRLESRESRALASLSRASARSPTSDLVSQCSLGLLFEAVFKMSLPSLILNINQKSIFHGIDLIFLSKRMWVVKKKTKKIFTNLDSFTILLQYFYDTYSIPLHYFCNTFTIPLHFLIP